MTQDEVSDKLGLKGECKRRSMTRYETGERFPKEERTKKIAKILSVSYDSIRKYDFTNPIDSIYVLMWMEEQYYDFGFKMTLPNKSDNKVIEKTIQDWNIMKKKLSSKEIKYKDYIEWKLTYCIDKSG